MRLPTPREAEGMKEMRRVLDRRRLNTVCQAARCPNVAACWSASTATFMLLGTVCTRGCRFCDVETGWPRGVIDESEPKRVADAVRELDIRYVVLTSVDRDDLPDGGAKAFADAVNTVSAVSCVTAVEALLPDFGADQECLRRLASTEAVVLGHNVETVRRLTPQLRDARASYDQSLRVLQSLKGFAPGKRTKSGLMVGLGETRDEILETMRDLRGVGVDMLTVGQYLQPSPREVAVTRYVFPPEFQEIEDYGRALGYRSVVAGPLVRSSYRAADAYDLP